MEATIKERPILFNADTVRAILDGRKTQTRRSIKVQPSIDSMGHFIWDGMNFGQEIDGTPCLRNFIKFHCPYGKVGDRLWVRETILQSLKSSSMPCGEYESYWTRENVEYCADNPAPIERFLNPNQIGSAWMCKRPSIHMPRWASRITLEITAVRVERLQDIAEADAVNEGLIKLPATGRYVVNAGDQYFGMADNDPRIVFSLLWDSIYKNWDQNPWVWVVEFKVIKP